MTTINLEALQALKSCLQDVEKEHRPFDMDHWADTSSSETITCQTTSCALGWFARSEAGKALGLSIAPHRESYRLFVIYQGQTTTGKEPFNISYRTAEWLFMPISYPWRKIKPFHVIERIDQILANPTHFE